MSTGPREVPVRRQQCLGGTRAPGGGSQRERSRGGWGGGWGWAERGVGGGFCTPFPHVFWAGLLCGCFLRSPAAPQAQPPPTQLRRPHRLPHMGRTLPPAAATQRDLISGAGASELVGPSRGLQHQRLRCALVSKGPPHPLPRRGGPSVRTPCSGKAPHFQKDPSEGQRRTREGWSPWRTREGVFFPWTGRIRGFLGEEARSWGKEG